MQEIYNRIIECLHKKDYQLIEKICLFELSRQKNPDFQLLFHLGNAARLLRKPKPALVAFKAALDIMPNDANTLQACASCYEALEDYDSAYENILRAAVIEPESAIVQANLAVALEKLGKHSEALVVYEKSLAIDELNLTANMNLGTLLYRLGKKSAALKHNRLAHARHPNRIGILFNLVDSLVKNYQYQEALAYCNTGLAAEPRHAHLMFKKGIVLSCLHQFDEAQVCLINARDINPQIIYDVLPYAKSIPEHINLILDAYGIYIEGMYEAQLSCFWRDRANYVSEINRMINDGDRCIAIRGPENGFKILSLDIGPSQRSRLMKTISKQVLISSKYLKNEPYIHSSSPSGKLRIGYLSPDFRFHATAILSRQIFGSHLRTEFEIYCYSLHEPDIKDDYYRLSIESNCDVFREISSLSTKQIADVIYKDQVNILIDLAGYTTHSRTEVMAMRPAPIQMQYLGFAATTMGADFIDYVIIDKQLCLDGKADEFTEQPIRLPHTIYPYDNQLDNSPTTFKRTDFDLPENAFVFCCLNNSYKIEPSIFDRWMNILKAVPDSVLWLLGKDLDVQENLEREAKARGVDKSRLVFTGRIPLEQHLPRYQMADLFLDTYWANAHTTGAEALWQGLPLITIMGEVPSARGAASILTALEMPELIVQNHDEYEQLAIYYATHPKEYAAMREKLKAKRYTAPMYNTKLTVKHIEKAYQMAWERYQAGLPPAAFDVPENTDPELRKSIH